MDFHSASLLTQQSADRHWDPLGHIILIPSQPDFALSPYCCVLSGETTNTNFIVFGLIQSGLDPKIYRPRGEQANHYTIDVVESVLKVSTYIITCRTARHIRITEVLVIMLVLIFTTTVILCVFYEYWPLLSVK